MTKRDKMQHPVTEQSEALGNTPDVPTVDAGIVEAPKPAEAPETTVDNSLDWKAIGFDEGAKIEASLAEAGKACIDMLVNFAEKLKGYAPSQLLFLDGYGTARGDTRKSEAKAVFEAYGIAKAGNNEKLTGEQAVNEALITAKSDWGHREEGKPGKNAYANFIEACRLIRGKKAQGRSAGTSNAPTEKQLKEVVERVGKADASQAVQVMTLATQRIADLTKTQKMSPVTIIGQIRTLAQSLQNPEAYDLAICDFGKNVDEQAYVMLERHRKAEDETRTKKAEMAASKGIVPTPAEAELAKAA